MDTVIVDTDIVSYTFKRDTRSALYRQHLQDHTLLISFMTLAELNYWAEFRQWGLQRRVDLATHLRQFAVIDSDEALCREWARTRTQVKQSGFEIKFADAWIAATALLYDVPLITHNRKDFACVKGLTIISEAPI